MSTRTGGNPNSISFQLKLFNLFALVFLSFSLFYLAGCIWIGYEVRRSCRFAQSLYGGNCVSALSTLIVDNQQSYSDRNLAIWSLGQIGDSRSYDSLISIYTGIIPDREPLDSTISQYEIKKAINLVSGGTNLSAWVWRWTF